MSSAELARLVAASVDPEAAAWLEKAIAGVAPGAGSALAAFVAASRKLGRGPLVAPADAVIPGPEDEVAVGHWSADRAGRAALLVAIVERAPAELERAATTLYREGDSREKAAVVASLALLPKAGRFVELALDAGRTNEVDLFRALALSNPFPARHYDELAFNKLVMKAAFLGLPLAGIVGLSRRANAELSRMGRDYIAERRAAGRSIPDDIHLAIAPLEEP